MSPVGPGGGAEDNPGDTIFFPDDDSVMTEEYKGDENEANIFNPHSRMLRSHVELENSSNVSGANCLYEQE